MNEFFTLLDSQEPERVDAAIVLRRKDSQADMEVRMSYGMEFVESGYTSIILMGHGDNTLEEAIAAMEYVREMKWNSIAIVTTKQHHYRAYLTFLRAMYGAGLNIKLICAATESIDGVGLDTELAKINEYQQKGDIETYEKGCAYIRRECN